MEFISDYVALDVSMITLDIVSTVVTLSSIVVDSCKKSYEYINSFVPEPVEEESDKEIELEIAHEEFGWVPVGKDTVSAVMSMAGGDSIKQSEYMEVLNNTRPLLEYTMYYLTNPNSELVTDFTESEKRFINGIAANLVPELGKIYEDVDTVDISIYMPSTGYNPLFNSEFLITQEDIDAMVPENFIEKVRSRWAKINWDQSQVRSDIMTLVEETKAPMQIQTGGPTYIGTDGMHHLLWEPIDNIYDSSLEVPVQPEGMSDEDFNKYELVFSAFVPEGYKHYYSYDTSGNTLMTIYTNKFNQSSRYIDNGRLMGGSHVWMNCYYCDPNNGSLQGILVDSTKFPEIIRKSLTSNLYVMTEDEYRNIWNYNARIPYYVRATVDLSNTPFLDRYNDHQISEFAKSCYFIANHLYQHGNSIRLRISEYYDPYHFKLVSDNECNKSLDWFNQMIAMGLSAEVKGNEIIIQYLDNRKRFIV